MYWVLKIGLWLLFCIALHIVIALPTIAIAIFVALFGVSEKVAVIILLSPLRARKNNNYYENFRERAIEKKQN